MKGTIRFSVTKGDGSKSEPIFTTGDLTVGVDKKCSLYFWDEEVNNHKTVKFTYSRLSIDSNFINVFGKTTDGNTVSFLFCTDDFWADEIEANRLRTMFNTTERYFREVYGVPDVKFEDIDFRELARDSLAKQAKS